MDAFQQHVLPSTYSCKLRPLFASKFVYRLVHWLTGTAAGKPLSSRWWSTASATSSAHSVKVQHFAGLKWPHATGYGRHHTWHNDTQHNVAQHNDAQHNDAQHNDAQHNAAQHNDAQHNDAQDNDAQHNDAQHNDTQHNDTQHNGAQ
jgi:hypothetical protein